MLEPPPFNTFYASAEQVLRHLQTRLGFQLWMVTRTVGDDWIVLFAADSGYGVQSGQVFRWADSFCSRMVQGLGPRIAPCSNEVPSYAAAPIGQQVLIGSYIGVPLTLSNGELFGTLCAIDPNPQTPAIVDEQASIELFAALLSRLLEAELRLEEQCRTSERLRSEATTDALTDLYNRRGWDHFFEIEDSRCRRYGHPACVFSIDLNGLKGVNDTYGHAVGDAHLRRAAEAIRTTIRAQDIAARFGGDEFMVLAVECNKDGGSDLLHRFQEAFVAYDVSASIGMSVHRPAQELTKTLKDADQAMYQQKRNNAFNRELLAAW